MLRQFEHEVMIILCSIFFEKITSNWTAERFKAPAVSIKYLKNVALSRLGFVIFKLANHCLGSEVKGMEMGLDRIASLKATVCG